MNFQEEGKNFLDHHGVKGQKWGVRRTKRAIQRSSDAERHATARKKHVSELSDVELRDLTNRLNTEQQFARLTQGQSMAKKILATAGTANALVGVLKSPAAIALAGIGASVAMKLISTSGAVGTIGKFG
jgi:hypothetical protein